MPIAPSGRRGADQNRFCRRERGLQIVGGTAGYARPDIGRSASNSFAVGLGARARHADGDGGGLWHGLADGLKMLGELRVAQQAQIGWTESSLPKHGRFVFSDDDAGAGAAAFDPEKERFRGCWPTFCHPPKYFGTVPFCKVFERDVGSWSSF